MLRLSLGHGKARFDARIESRAMAARRASGGDLTQMQVGWVARALPFPFPSSCAGRATR